MARVDPFVIQWPRKWLEDPEIRPVIEYLNRFLHDLFLRTGGGTDSVASLGTLNNRSVAALIEIDQRLGSGDALTCDETGFTVDSDRLTADQTEA